MFTVIMVVIGMQLRAGPQTLFNEHVAVANAARLHLHAHLSSAGLREVTFYQFPVSAWFADLRRLHCVPYLSLLQVHTPHYDGRTKVENGSRWESTHLLL